MKSKIWGFIASAGLLLGAFLPIVQIPFFGTLNYFLNGRGDGVFIVILAAACAVLVVFEQFKFLLIPAAGSLTFEVFTMTRLTSLLDTQYGASIHFGWGWAVLIGSSAALMFISVNFGFVKNLDSRGDERSVQKHSGPDKKIARDFVDNRQSFAEWTFFTVSVALLSSIFVVGFAGMLALTVFNWVQLICLVVDAFLISHGLKKIYQNLGIEKPSGVLQYALKRSFVPKSLRKFRDSEVL